MSTKPTSSEKVLVTGGSGYVGSILVEYLLQKGLSVRIMDHSDPVNRSVDFVRADIQHVPESVFDNISSVVHLAGFSNESAADKNPGLTQKINTLSAIDLAKKAKKSGVKRFVFASSAAIYDQGIENATEEKTEDAIVKPKGFYSISKYKAEQGILPLNDNNFSVVVLRKATVNGFSPKMRFDLVVNAMVKAAITNKQIKIFSKGLQWRPIISISDVSEAYYKTLIQPKEKISGQIFNIVYDNFLVKDIAILVQQTLSKEFSIETQILSEGDDLKGRSYRMTKQKAHDVLGFTATTTVEDIVKHLFRNFQENNI